MTVMLVTLLCWELNDGDYLKMLVTFFCMLVTFQSVTNIQNMPECDVGDWYLMLVPNDVSNIRHQHWCYPTSWRVLNEVEKSNERLRWESLSTSLRIFQLHIGLTGPRLICNVFTHSSLNATWNDYLTDL